MMTSHNTRTNNSGGLATGLAVGAAIGAAAVALSDKKNQQKVKHAVHTVKKWAEEKTGEFKSASKDMFDKTEEEMEDIKEKMEDEERPVKHAN